MQCFKVKSAIDKTKCVLYNTVKCNIIPNYVQKLTFLLSHNGKIRDASLIAVLKQTAIRDASLIAVLKQTAIIT